jgi:hypothetical protein
MARLPDAVVVRSAPARQDADDAVEDHQSAEDPVDRPVGVLIVQEGQDRCRQGYEADRDDHAERHQAGHQSAADAEEGNDEQGQAAVVQPVYDGGGPVTVVEDRPADPAQATQDAGDAGEGGR